MKAIIKTLNQRPAWKALAAHHKTVKKLHLRELFAEDPRRGQTFSTEAAGLFLDYSKNRITDKTLRLLFQLADESGLRAKIEAMFSGEKINVTENRAVLHVALARAEKCDHSSGRKKCRAGGPSRSRKNGSFLETRPQWRVERTTGKRISQHREHRHRRVRSWTGDGLRSAQALQ